MSEMQELVKENKMLKEIIQSVLDYGLLYHSYKKILWNVGFKVEFPREYKWMKRFKMEGGRK